MAGEHWFYFLLGLHFPPFPTHMCPRWQREADLGRIHLLQLSSCNKAAETQLQSHHLLSEICAVPLLFRHLQFHCFKSWASLLKIAQLALFTPNLWWAPLLAAAAGLRRCCPGPCGPCSCFPPEVTALRSPSLLHSVLLAANCNL